MQRGGEKPRDEFPMRETIRQAERMLPHRNVFGQAGGIVPVATQFRVSGTPHSGDSVAFATSRAAPLAGHLDFRGPGVWVLTYGEQCYEIQPASPRKSELGKCP